MKQFIAVILIIGVLYTMFIPKVAYTKIVFDPLQYGLQTIWQFIEQILNAVIKQLILSGIIQKIINYISGGGVPKFILNWGQFLAGSYGFGANQILVRLPQLAICNPYKPQLIQSANLRFGVGMTRDLICIDQIINNPQFYTNFNVARWNGFMNAYSPGGNYYIDSHTAYEEALLKAVKEAQSGKNEGISSEGFLSTKDALGLVKVPGSNVAQSGKDAVKSPIDFIVNTMGQNLASLAGALIAQTINRLITNNIFR